MCYEAWLYKVASSLWHLTSCHGSCDFPTKYLDLCGVGMMVLESLWLGGFYYFMALESFWHGGLYDGT